MPMFTVHEPVGKEKNCTIAILVNLEGIANDGVMKYVKDNCAYWYKEYVNKCNSGVLEDKGYLICQYANKYDLVSIPVKRQWKDKPDIDFFIENLLKFDKGFLLDGPCGHGVHRVRIPLSGFKYSEVESKLKEALKDTYIEFVFCIRN